MRHVVDASHYAPFVHIWRDLDGVLPATTWSITGTWRNGGCDHQRRWVSFLCDSSYRISLVIKWFLEFNFLLVNLYDVLSIHKKRIGFTTTNVMFFADVPLIKWHLVDHLVCILNVCEFYRSRRQNLVHFEAWATIRWFWNLYTPLFWANNLRWETWDRLISSLTCRWICIEYIQTSALRSQIRPGIELVRIIAEVRWKATGLHSLVGYWTHSIRWLWKCVHQWALAHAPTS